MIQKLMNKLFPCKYNEPKCVGNILGCRCGKGKSEEPPPRVTAEQSAAETLAAQQATNPAAAQLAFDIAKGPAGVEAYTGLLEQARSNIFKPEEEVRQQTLSNILESLLSPTGISAQQRAAQDAIRQRAVEEAQRSQRTRANLGGGLFGGRSQASEAMDINKLMQTFAAEDIDREAQARQQAIANAGAMLSLLFPQISLQSTPFQSPAPSGGEALQAGVSQRGQDIQYQQAQAQADAALKSALFSSLGTAGAAALAPATGGLSLMAMPGASQGVSPGMQSILNDPIRGTQPGLNAPLPAVSVG